MQDININNPLLSKTLDLKVLLTLATNRVIKKNQEKGIISVKQ